MSNRYIPENSTIIKNIDGEETGVTNGDLNVTDEIATQYLSGISNQLSATFKKTYSASRAGFVTTTNPTDILTISGSDTKLIKILYIHLSATQTNSGFVEMAIIKRNSANSGGTTETLINVAHDSEDDNATAIVKIYTTNATALGNSVGRIYSEKSFIPSGNSSAPGASSHIDFQNLLGKPITLHGSSEILCVNFNGATVSGANFVPTIVWTEE